VPRPGGTRLRLGSADFGKLLEKHPSQPQQFALPSALRTECQREGPLAELIE
jgi:hypothetical protein